MQTTAPPLDYATPTAARKANTRGMWVAHVMVMLAAGGGIELFGAFVVGQMKQIYLHEKVELPAITQTVLLVCDWAAHPLGWVALAVLAFAVPSLVWARYRHGRPELALGISMLLSTIVLQSLALLTILVLFVPFITILAHVNASPAPKWRVTLRLQ